MALGSHLITVRRLEKYINDVIGKKANLPDTSKTIIGNISQINSDLTDNYSVLWTNPNPSSDFSPANLSIAGLSNYKAIVVIFKEYKTHSDYISQLVPVISEFRGRLFVAGGDSHGYAQNSYRGLIIHTDTNKITFENAGYNRVDAGSNIANDQVIPYKILGVI